MHVSYFKNLFILYHLTFLKYYYILLFYKHYKRMLTDNLKEVRFYTRFFYKLAIQNSLSNILPYCLEF